MSTPALDWRLRPPPADPWAQHSMPAPGWLKEVRALRGCVLFDNGRRPAFKTEGGNLSDDDPLDLYSHHVLAYRGSMLIGCLRVYQLANSLPCLTDAVLGERAFATMLRTLGADRKNAVELGRWMLHPNYRAGGHAAMKLAASGTAVAIRLVQNVIVICSIGTLDRQHVLLRRIGMLNAPDTKPVQDERFGDRLQVMYCDNLQRLNRGFCELVDHMAQALQLAPLC